MKCETVIDSIEVKRSIMHVDNFALCLLLNEWPYSDAYHSVTDSVIVKFL